MSVNFHGVDQAHQEEINQIIENDFGGGEWDVYTEVERETAATEYIKDSLWAFNANFLASQTGIPQVVFDKLVDLSEGAQEAIEALVEKTCGIESFVSAAVQADGYGHFLSSYDGNEEEVTTEDGTTYFAYQN